MPLVQLKLSAATIAIPRDVSTFINDAKRRVDEFIESRVSEPVHSFVPSDFSAVYEGLRHLWEANLAVGSMFCEWGSGAGVVTCLAAMVGFDACGIEFERDLVELSTRLAKQYKLNVRFYCGNLVPHGGQKIAEDVDEFEWLAVGGADAYEEMGLEIQDFDVIFAFPWPGEERVILRLFDRFASNGALLMTYDATEGVRLFRKHLSRR